MNKLFKKLPDRRRLCYVILVDGTHIKYAKLRKRKSTNAWAWHYSGGSYLTHPADQWTYSM